MNASEAKSATVFGSLKHEWTNHENYADLDAAKFSVFYNPKRIYQALGYVSRQQYEAEHAPAMEMA